MSLITVARLMVIPARVLGLELCAVWARQLYGSGAGLTAAMLWCFSPRFLGDAGLIAADVAADVAVAAVETSATCQFRRWIQNPGWARTIL